MEWVAIGLAFVAVIVILRYARRPRCELCRRRHDRRPGLGVLPSDVVPDPWFVPASGGPAANGRPLAGPTPGDEPDDADVAIDLTSRAREAEPAPDGPLPVAISWRADAVPSPDLSSLN